MIDVPAHAVATADQFLAAARDDATGITLVAAIRDWLTKLIDSSLSRAAIDDVVAAVARHLSFLTEPTQVEVQDAQGQPVDLDDALVRHPGLRNIVVPLLVMRHVHDDDPDLAGAAWSLLSLERAALTEFSSRCELVASALMFLAMCAHQTQLRVNA